jgi:hypothetical protein
LHWNKGFDDFSRILNVEFKRFKCKCTKMGEKINRFGRRRKIYLGRIIKQIDQCVLAAMKRNFCSPSLSSSKQEKKSL